MKLKRLRELRFYKDPIITLENMPDGYAGLVFAPYIPMQMVTTTFTAVAFTFDNLGHDTIEATAEECITNVEYLHDTMPVGFGRPPIIINRGVRSELSLTLRTAGQTNICNRLTDLFYLRNSKFDMCLTRMNNIGVPQSKTFVKGCLINEIEYFQNKMRLTIIPDYFTHQIDYGE